MKHLNYIDLTEKLNRFRMEHQSKTYTREELLKELKKLGMSSVYAQAFISKGVIPYEKVGKAYLYSFDSNPIHKSVVESVYYNRKTYRDKKVTIEVLSDEDKKVKAVKDLGYEVRKPVGFDMERFKKENPVLYKRYLKYEVV